MFIYCLFIGKKKNSKFRKKKIEKKREKFKLKQNKYRPKSDDKILEKFKSPIVNSGVIAAKGTV